MATVFAYHTCSGFSRPAPKNERTFFSEYKKRSPLSRAPSPIVNFSMEVYDTNRRSLEGDAAAAQQLCEVAGKDNGGNGNRYETADNHGREHLAHEVTSFVRILCQGVAGALGDDCIARESVEGGEAVGQCQRETHSEPVC